MIPPITSILRWSLFAQCISAQISSPSSVLNSSMSTTFFSSTTSGTLNATATPLFSTQTPDVIGITGRSTLVTSRNSTATTAASPQASNTRPCNGHVEYCNRKFSNITQVMAHNSPFVRERNAASNQALEVEVQLRDGIRGLQFATIKPNSTSDIRLCHSSCDLLDVGTLESYLIRVKTWLDSNPYEVIAIIIGNNPGQSDRIAPSEYAAVFQSAGMLEHVWTPPASSMSLSDWPTLSQMILLQNRVVVMLDYGADQSTVPWLMSEFNYMWETPFSPTDASFPCTQDRPADQAEDVSRDRMYMANHNLNIALTAEILIPAYSLLNQVNADAGNGSVGLAAANCEAAWGRPPNWLLVDYYNFGTPFNGSVFEVAAQANGVEYDRASCCGSERTSGAGLRKNSVGLAVCAFLFVFVFWG
ncbi:PLC-like phosphodiesterase [Dothidotthia symphoricarpi CBS 119687]|uniref:PLC-like phosphodiesterase n=1 Tax=Dothidotthia symphoricarpi CBS 119687 TaxID=1392245 RepID=A0A6A6AHK8_9PLEO|nr:PLC-like phosphodiesterase [Dothidotthia symphoricarpi CBS 119687]KAF2130387.1 PLC-like phosphodiesterase [Dothidotthia symphoricarpi CBS 119687]